jgi:polyphosphate glucokinase
MPDNRAAALTLAFDIGGSHLKAAVLSPQGVMISDRVRVPTPRPAQPDAVVEALVGMAGQLRHFDRISIGFPGVVRRDTILTAPNLGTKSWKGLRLAAILSETLGAPARMLNDASVQGLGVIDGCGVECVLTLGTGMGFALFLDGRLSPHLEMSQHPIKGGKTYDEYVGEKALKKVGRRRWSKRVGKIIEVLETVVMYDTLYLGGGNAQAIALPLPTNAKIVSNEAGITGGVRVWDERMDHLFEEPLQSFGTAAEPMRPSGSGSRAVPRP